MFFGGNGMKLGWNLVSAASLAITLNLGMSQKTFAQNTVVPISIEETKNIIGPLYDRATETISKDITDTKAKIQKSKDVNFQRAEIQSLLLRITGLMTSYAPSRLNLYSAYYSGEPIFMPYALIGFEGIPNLNVSWLEHSKSPADFPQFNEPLKLIDIIASKFAEVAADTKEDSKEDLEILNALPPSQPGSISPSQNPPSRPKAIDPSMLSTKYLRTLRKHRETST
jgi:hypothetical protein